MIQRVSVPITVELLFDAKIRKVIPKSVVWEGKSFPITKVGMHHTQRDGIVLYHIFSVESPSLFFRLKLNTDDLQWTLEEIADGEPD